MGIFRGSTLSGDALANIDIVADNIDNVNAVGTNIANVNTVAGDIADVSTVAGIAADVSVVAGISSDVSAVENIAANVTSVAGNATNINTVAGNSTNINAVAGNATNINAVNANSTNINTVATNIANVNSVGANIANVNSVASNSTNINTVATDIADITTVAADIADVSTVAGSIVNVNAVAGIDQTDLGDVANIAGDVTIVAGIAPNVTTVAGISSNVTSVAGNATNINAVAGNNTNITAVAGNATNINAVAGNATNINTVAGISANVTTVAGISANVTTVATNNANVTTVAGSIANVNTVAGNISNVNQVAADTVAINSASANATAAANSATAAATSATNAATSAAQASAVALGNEPVRHSVRPSLLLDFANTKTLDPRITFTRASTGTFYDGKTVAKAEENLLVQSETFDNASWFKGNTTVSANAGTAPDGNTTADLIYPSTTGTLRQVRQAGLAVQMTTQTRVFSFYAKASGFSWVQSFDPVTGGQQCWFDVTNGVTGTAAAGHTTSIVSVGNGWYRCIVITAVAYASDGRVGIALADSNGSSTATANGTDGILLWGAQLEQRSSVTAYTPTTTQAITNYIPALQTAASGVARFEHNPVTGESLGLEIEEQRTNLLTYSEDLSNAAWTKINTTINSNVLIAPDGTLTADRVVEAATTNNFRFRQAATTITSGQALTFTAYAKEDLTSAKRYLRVTMGDTGGTNEFLLVQFDLANGTVRFSQLSTNGTSAGYVIISSSATSVGNGYYRVQVSGTFGTKTSITTQCSLINVDAATITGGSLGGLNYTGDGYSGFYIWGAQLEAGAFATSYIKTEGSQVTRNADSASMTGTNFSSWYRADEGTLYSELVNISYADTQRWISINDGTVNNRILQAYRTNTSTLGFIMSNNGTLTVNINASASATPKIAFAVKNNDAAISVNGAAPLTDTSCTVPIVNRLQLGNAEIAVGTCTIKKFAYYPLRLTNSEIQSLTTV